MGWGGGMAGIESPQPGSFGEMRESDEEETPPNQRIISW